jgi:2-C-methyl-D-erythritol 2,4-cyclodiphosphate synthase
MTGEVLYRIGMGYDVHRLTAGRPLMLGCVHFDESPLGLDGHSDADVVAHAVCDALLGAAGLGDIGEHFPPADPRYKDFPGGAFLGRTAGMLRDAGYEIVNVDCVVMSDSVTLGGRKKAMEVTMAGHLGVESGRVNVGATTHEGTGPVGRGEVIACGATALVRKTSAR